MSPLYNGEELLVFEICSIEGEYGERSPSTDATNVNIGTAVQPRRGGILRLPASDGEFVFIEV